MGHNDPPTVIGIPHHQVAGMEPRLRPFLAEFTEGGKFTVRDLIEDIHERLRQCWVVFQGGEIRAVALTQIGGDRLNTCRITHLTGNGLHGWKDAFLAIEAWAAGQGCARIEAIARPGYERVGKPFGLKKTHVLLEKEL